MRARKYKTIDSKFLWRFWDAMHRQHRHCVEFRNNKDCGRTVFIRRILKKFQGKCYAVIDNVDTGYLEKEHEGDVFFRKKVKVPMKLYVYLARIDYGLCYAENLRFTYCVAHPDKTVLQRHLEFNELLDLKWREITLEEYKNVQEMFSDDSVKPKKEEPKP
jgi:hypothetical protein